MGLSQRIAVCLQRSCKRMYKPRRVGVNRYARRLTRGKEPQRGRAADYADVREMGT